MQAIAAGLDGNLALTTDGAPAAWGYNQLGQVGDGVTSATRAVPTAVSVENGVSVLSGKAIISLADSGSASDHFMALYAALPEVIPEQMIPQGISQSWRGVTSSADGVKMAAVANNGYLHTSTDSGLTWTARTALGQKSWYDVASSSDGSKLVAFADSSRIFTSTDSGANWTEQFGSNSNVQWRTVASSADGTKLIAAANQDRIYTSTDSGITWTGRFNNGNWHDVASSADGTKLVAVQNSGNIYTSTDSGASWTARMTDQSRNWFSVASSADGTKLVASVYGGQLYTSIDSGITWTARDSSRNWRLVASSADGSQLIAAERDGLIYVSSDSGVNWTTLDSTRDWYGVAISADGAKILASVFGGQIYTLGSAPEIAVEQPALTDLSSGSTTDFGSVLTGDTADLTFTIRNPGNATLTGLGITIDGTDAGLFTLTASPTGPLDPGDTTTFTVRFAPLSIGGLKSATLQIASNDSDESPFNLLLSGTALDSQTDTDGDGLNDAAEYRLAALGFDWQVTQIGLVEEFLSTTALFTQSQYDASRQTGRDDVTLSPNTYGLFNLTQVQALNVGTPLLQRTGSDQFKLTIAVEKTTSLSTSFAPLPMSASETSINAQGELEFLFTVPEDTAFFRLEAK